MRKAFIAGNWKMFKTPSEAGRLAGELVAVLGDPAPVEVAVCPATAAIARVAEALNGTPIALGAQNVHPEAEGAFTGENSVPMLADLRVKYVITGHSERRHVFGEKDEYINAKVLAVARGGLHPILCVGELLEDREAGRTFDVVRRQLNGGLSGFPEEKLELLTIAYEPVWAIGTGKTATPEIAQEVHAFIRGCLGELWGDAATGTVPVQYGGSVKPENARDLIIQPDIDGFLVGGASLKAGSFGEIVAAAAGDI